MTILGNGFTVMVMEEVEQSGAVTVYVVVVIGLAETIFPEEIFKPLVGYQVNALDEEDAVRVVCPPWQMERLEAEILIGADVLSRTEIVLDTPFAVIRSVLPSPFKSAGTT